MIIKENQPRKESKYKDPYRLRVLCPTLNTFPEPIKGKTIERVATILEDIKIPIELLENNSDGTYQICLPGVVDCKRIILDKFNDNGFFDLPITVTESNKPDKTKLSVKEDWDDDEDLGDLDDNLCNYIEDEVGYSLRAKWCSMDAVGDSIEFEYISQEDMDSNDAEIIVMAAQRWADYNKPEWHGKTCKCLLYCRSYPDNDFHINFTVGEQGVEFVEDEPYNGLD
ncbi:MAG: hypothetical protein IJA19_00695 [Clostridia bacterium]|nr:hypothetical protein [Clostridia bacterium]